MTREQFFEAMEKHKLVLQEAYKVLSKHGIEGSDIEVDAVVLVLAVNKEEVHIRYVFEWGGVYAHDSIIVPAEEFWEEEEEEKQDRQLEVSEAMVKVRKEEKSDEQNEH